ncbi:MAG: sigma-70 family RNA polymerase sigma factor [Acidobacteriota bacterium]
MTAPASQQQSSPADLVRRIQAGDAAAEEEVVTRYARGLSFMLLELAGDPARAEDLQQETFRLAIEKVRAGELREPDKLVAFLRSLGRNLFIAEYRRTAKQPLAGGEEAVALSQDAAPSPLSRLLAKENASIVRRLLSQLEPPRDRELLFRFFVSEHPKDAICADLGLSSLHFNRVLHRARGRLKKLLVGYHKRGKLPMLSGQREGSHA